MDENVSNPIPVAAVATGGTLSRFIAAGISLGLVVLLVVASFLTPSEAGLGTHHQLGLPQCSLRALVGMRCPSCGMTTSWAHFVRGNWVASARVNTGGLLLAIYALFTIPIAARVAWTKRLPSELILRRGAFALVGIVIVTTIDWVLRLTVLAG